MTPDIKLSMGNVMGRLIEPQGIELAQASSSDVDASRDSHDDFDGLCSGCVDV